MNKNLLLLSDSYKYTHWRQYPPGTEYVYSYFESRGGRFQQTVFFGLQYFLKEYLEGEVITLRKLQEARSYLYPHFGREHGDYLINNEGFKHIIQDHKGMLPVSIKAVPEGLVIPTSNVLMTINNTCQKCNWLTNFLETLLVQVWYPCTVATLSREIRKLISVYLEETGNSALIDYKLHDFGFRGVSSVESATIGGMAHLINFFGTDTVASLVGAREYYACTMAGNSIPASEHSTITSWGRENEQKAMKNMLDQYGKLPLLACVSDSYNIFDACSKIWGERLKKDVLNIAGTLVVRPDSGYPPEVIRKCLVLLGESFGYEINEKGYKVLNPKVRLIQGDGVDYEMIHKVLESMREDGWSADNIAFGMGGALLQKLNRDTQKFAFKCSNITIDNQDKDVFKKPITDDSKVSKAGKLKLVMVEGAHGKVYRTLRSEISSEPDILQEVFRDGKILREYSFDEVRKNAEWDTMYWDVPRLEVIKR